MNSRPTEPFMPEPVPAPDPVSAPIPRKMHFSAPNAKAGEAYRAPIDGRDEHGQAVLVTQARLSPEVGLVFDSATGVLQGTPTLSGEHTVVLSWQDELGHPHDGAFVLLVNANPRDLWKCIDPDPSALYFKPNEDSRRLEAVAGRRLAAASKRGRSHAHVGSFRDDDFFIGHDAGSGWSVMVVTDGAGSAKNSRHGAALAAQQAGGHLLAALSSEEGGGLAAAVSAWLADAAVGAKPLKDRCYLLFGQAAWSALRAIETAAVAQQAEARDYATTLLCTAHRATPEGVFVTSFWLGDGAICALGPAGQARLMGRPDGGEFAGQTRFLDRTILGDADALWGRIEIGHHPELTALVLMTDGVSDPCFESDHQLADPARWASLWAELQPVLDREAPEQALLEWMDFFKPGHHDDRTLALWW